MLRFHSRNMLEEHDGQHTLVTLRVLGSPGSPHTADGSWNSRKSVLTDVYPPLPRAITTNLRLTPEYYVTWVTRKGIDSSWACEPACALGWKSFQSICKKDAQNL